MSEFGFIDKQGDPRHYEGIWASIRKEAADKGIPIHGHFELTPQCNLNCKMCYVHLNTRQMKGIRELSCDTWINLIDSAIEEGMIFASLSGGECLLYPYFDEIYKHLNSKGVIITVLTNGVLLESKLELFKKYPPSYIQVSFYGYDEESYERVTGFRHYKTVLNAIENAVLCNLPVGVSVTCSKYLKDINAIVKLFKEKGIGVSINNWLMPPYESTERKLDDINISLEENIKIASDFYVLNNKEYPIPYSDYLPDPNTDSSQKIYHGIKCAAGRSDFSINWKGEMSMCVAINATTGYPLQETFANAWNKTNTAAKNFQIPVECPDCNYYLVCNHCPAQHLIDNTPYGHCNKKVCQETVELIKHGIINFVSN